MSWEGVRKQRPQVRKRMRKLSLPRLGEAV